MGNAKHIGCMSALAVALGLGMAAANTPAVALAAPADSGKSSSSSDSSHDSGSTSSGRASNENANSPDSPTAATAETATTDAPQKKRGSDTSRAASDSTSTKKSTSSAAGANAADNDPAADDNSKDFTRSVAPVAARTAASASSTAATPEIAQSRSATTDNDPTPADPVSQIVTTLVNAVLSPFVGSAPTAPVQSPAEFTLLAAARREFEPTATVDPPADQITNGLVTGNAASTSQDLTAAADPGFITSVHDFGLFKVTSAADPDDNNFVAFVFESPIFTFVLTSGTDPEDNLGFGAASTGVAGNTVATFITPIGSFPIAIPIEDPFATLFTDLVRAGF